MASNSPPPTSSNQEWTKEKNKRFEKALAIYSDRVDDNWHNIVMYVGDTTEEEVKRYYDWLVEDIKSIEAGLVPIPTYKCSQVNISSEEKRPGDSKGKAPTEDE